MRHVCGFLSDALFSGRFAGHLGPIPSSIVLPLLFSLVLSITQPLPRYLHNQTLSASLSYGYSYLSLNRVIGSFRTIWWALRSSTGCAQPGGVTRVALVGRRWADRLVP